MQINIEKKHFWVLVVMISLIAVAVFVYALQLKGASTSNEFGHYSFDVEGIEPDYDSGWFPVDSSSGDYEIQKLLILGGGPLSRYSLLQCGAINQSNECTTRVMLSGGYQDGTSFINPVSVSVDNKNVMYIGISGNRPVWGYWTPSGWKYDNVVNNKNGYYKVLAWK